MNVEHSERRSRILVVTRNLPPLVGGMERLNWHMIAALKDYAEIRVVGPAGASRHMPADIPVSEAPIQPLSRFLFAAQWRACRMAYRWRPDLVLAGSGLTAPLAWLTAAIVPPAATAVYVHGLDLAVKSPIYRAAWLPAVRRMTTVIANSRATATLAQNVGVPAHRLHIVPPGVALPERADYASRAQRWRHDQQLSGPLLLSIGRLTTRKGVLEFVRDVLPDIVAEFPHATLLVVGDPPAQALRARAQTPEQILDVARAQGVAGHIRFLGTITDRDEIATIYTAADTHVFPVRTLENDPEGFGMVAVEAAAYGVPTIAYATGGVVDAVEPGQSGCLVEPDDAVAFAAAVCRMLRQPPPAASIRAHAARFAWPEFGRKLAQIIGP